MYIYLFNNAPFYLYFIYQLLCESIQFLEQKQMKRFLYEKKEITVKKAEQKKLFYKFMQIK